MNLSQAVDLYLQSRRSFGFVSVQVGVELGSLVRYAQRTAHQGPLTPSLVTQWAEEPQHCAPGYRVRRMDIARRLAEFWRAYEPGIQIPVRGSFGPAYQRRAVHIYSGKEISLLLEVSDELGRVHPLRATTFRTLVGLLDCTGLRIGEALRLSEDDIDWAAGLLRIHHAKNGHARLVPVHPSTLRALRRYRTLRNQAVGSGMTRRFFVTFRGKPLGYFGVSIAFRKLCQSLDWTQPPIPRLHDLRHTFAVRTLVRWYRSGEPVGPKLWTLSTYLGHQHLADTYWYLTAVPELMELSQQRFANAQAWASGGNHE